jgi:hypothetical protein
MLENMSFVKKGQTEKEESQLAMRLLDNDMNDMMSMARNTRTAV